MQARWTPGVRCLRWLAEAYRMESLILKQTRCDYYGTNRYHGEAQKPELLVGESRNLPGMPTSHEQGDARRHNRV
jgi:hypothetical protein